MNIFDIVGENFFKPLTSQFKILYLDCLTIIYDSYRSELSYGIDREILVSKLSDYFERSNISDIEFEDETEILKDNNAKDKLEKYSVGGDSFGTIDSADDEEADEN